MFYPHFKSVLVGLGLAMALYAVLMSTSATAKTHYYPTGNQNPIEVGTEEYLESYACLAGLEGVHVVTKYIFGSAKKYKLNDINSDLVLRIREQLEAVVLRMLSTEELKITPGQPPLTFYNEGTSEQNHAVNRRVVIIPQRDQS